MRLDLHVHTTASDGVLSPAEVVGLAGDGGLDVLAITDHDTVAGIPEAIDAAAETALRLIPGIEVSSTHEGAEYHILGYFVDVQADSIKAHERHAVGGRESRMDQMVDHLRRQGLLIEMTDVLEAAGPDRSAIARPHLARAPASSIPSSSRTHSNRTRCSAASSAPHCAESAISTPDLYWFCRRTEVSPAAASGD